MNQLDIVKLIEENPITNLSKHYNVKLLMKIKDTFTEFEQHMFLASFYCFFNCDPVKDYVVDFDAVWKWVHFSTKQKALRILTKYFLPNVDFIKLNETNQMVKQDEEVSHGGHNKERYMLNVNTFKRFCLKAGTKKADEIHNYYVKLETMIQETIHEECCELKTQLQNKDIIIYEKQKEMERALVAQFPVNTECIYIGTIDNSNENGESLIKFGHTNNLSIRVNDHHKHYNNFVLHSAFRVQNKVEVENLIKRHPKIKPQIRTIAVNGNNKTEIIAYNDQFTIDALTKIIKDIIQSKIYSIENFAKLTQRNEYLENENVVLQEKLLALEATNLTQTIEINCLTDKIAQFQETINVLKVDNASVYQNAILPEDELTQMFGEFVNEACIVRPDVQEVSVNLEGRYRLWSKLKPSKEVFHALKQYLDTRFRPKRVDGNHGYVGVKLKTVEYKKISNNTPVETFVFAVCEFKDAGKILNSTLLREYQQWKISVGRELTDDDMKDIKHYLNNSPHTLKATVWVDGVSNEGYYGLSMKTPYAQKDRITSSTGKKVYKIHHLTGDILATWETIAKAAEMEGVCSAKMSRYIKQKTIVNDYCYSTNKTN